MNKNSKTFLFCLTTVLLSLCPVLSHASWGKSTIDDATYAGYYTSIAVDVNNNIHIAYIGDIATYLLRYAKWDGSSWTFENVDTSGIPSFKYPSIAVDVQGNPHIAYYDNDAGASDLKYATRTTSGWGTQVVDSAGDVGQYSSLALDSRGNPHIAYYDATNTNLKYAKWTGSNWDIQTVDSEDAASDGKYCSIALDGLGNPHISYSKETTVEAYNTKYAKWTPQSSWVYDNVDTMNSGKNTSIAIDGNGTVHISYDDTGTEILYASSTASGWSYKSIYFGAVTNVNSIALDGNGNAHIAYHDSANYKLRYSSHPNWASIDVDQGAPSRDMGQYNSLAFNSDGRACIVYSSYNANSLNYDLRFATSSFTLAAPMGGNSRSKVQAPTNFGGSAVSGTAIDWSWTNNSSNAIGYRVYCSSAGGNFYLAASTSTLSGNGQTGWSHTGLSPNTSYQAYAAAVNAGGVVTSSSSLVWTMYDSNISVPAIPQNFHGESPTTTEIKWVWDSVTGVTYKLFDQSDDQIGGTITSGLYSEDSLSPNTVYSRYVVAYNAGGNSTPTATTSCYTLADEPAGLTMLSITDHTIKLQWTASNATFFKMVRTLDETGATPVAISPISTTTYTDTSLGSGKQYQYKIYSYNGNSVLNNTYVSGSYTTNSDTTEPQAPSIDEPAVDTTVQPGGEITITGVATDASTENFSKVIVTIYDQDNRVLWSDSGPVASGVRTVTNSSFFTNNLSISVEGIISGTIGIASNFCDYFPMATKIKIGIQLEDDGTNRSPEPVPSTLTGISIVPNVTSPKVTVYNSLIKSPSSANYAVIRYELPSPGFVSVKLYDLQGRLVKTIFEGQDSTNVKYWYGKNSAGNDVASGVYLLHIKAGGVETVKKIVVVK